MRTNIFLYPCSFWILFDIVEHCYSRYCLPPWTNKQKILVSFLYIDLTSVWQPVSNFLDGHIGDWHQSLLAPLSLHFYKTLIGKIFEKRSTRPLRNSHPTATGWCFMIALACSLALLEISSRQMGSISSPTHTTGKFIQSSRGLQPSSIPGYLPRYRFQLQENELIRLSIAEITSPSNLSWVGVIV